MLKNSIPKNKGYEIFEATDGQDGIKKYQMLKPDVVFMDLTMPQMKGTELAEKMLELRPDLPIILSTGNAEKIRPDDVSTIGIREVVMKPLRKRELAMAVRRTLDRAR